MQKDLDLFTGSGSLDLLLCQTSIPFRNRDQSSDVSSYSKPSYLSSSSSAAPAEGEYSDYSKRVSETLARHGQNQR